MEHLGMIKTTFFSDTQTDHGRSHSGFDGLCGDDVTPYPSVLRGHLEEAYDQLSSLNLLNRKGGRNRVIALCEEQDKDGVALWKQFTDIFRDTMICFDFLDGFPMNPL